MESLAIQRQQHVLLGQRRNFDPSLFDPRTKPTHIQSKKGNGGRPVKLLTNYFPLICSRDWVLHQYRVDFNPEVDHKGARRGMLRDHREKLGNFMFDGTMLFSTKLLEKPSVEVFSQRRTDGTNVRITITHTNELPPDSPVSLQLYNIVFRRVLELIDMKQVGRHYYNPTMSTVVQCQRVSFELWPGFQTSILQYEKRVMLCAEISHKLMRKETVLDIINQYYHECRNTREFQERVAKFLIGQIVLTKYNNNTYRIDGIEWELNVSQTFERRKQPITYIAYYKEQYNLDIRDQHQPLLVSRPKKREIRRGGLEVIHLVPELCTVTGLTDELRADYSVMKALGQHTKQGPADRVASLNKFVGRICSNKSIREEFDKWGLNLSNRLLALEGDSSGRVLPPEKIKFANTIYDGSERASWDSELRNIQMLSCVDLRDWFIIHTPRDNRAANEFVSALTKVSRNLGFNVARPSMAELQNDRVEQFQRVIKEIMGQQRPPQLLCCMLPSNRKDRYDAVKRLCCVDTPVPSQVVLAKTVGNPKRLMSVATKIAIQMNCKLGGEAWTVNIPLEGCMIVGIDTYHDSSQRGRSVGGFVASLNRRYTRWYSNVTFQQSGVELIDGLKRCMRGALMKYHDVNRVFPGRIIIYRDGVGDGQLEMLLQHEIPQLIECFHIENNPEYKPHLTFIVVKKRINARFFLENERRRQLENPPPGTVIDDEVTRPDWYDFYVVSQSVREGTVSPTHYNVIHDTSSLKPDHLQRLSYKLCHLYFNWAGTIRVPAPCLYAHKLAFLVGQSIHSQVAPVLNDRLYFL